MKKYLLVPLSALIVVGLLHQFSTQVYTQGLGNCDPNHDVKVDGEQFVTDINKRWVKAIIKAGSQNQGDACFEFTQDGDNGCYAVFGLGTDTAHAVKIGSGRDCKDISHVEFFAEDVEATPNPSPSASPSPPPSIDPSPSPSVDPSPTPDPTPSVSPIPSPSASPTPSSTPVTESVEKQQEKVMEEVRKENPELLGVVGFK